MSEVLNQILWEIPYDNRCRRSHIYGNKGNSVGENGTYMPDSFNEHSVGNGRKRLLNEVSLYGSFFHQLI
ncbi:hypothetical protein BLX87_19795 [Bacillus sp. VT-16-64]|nr:hypothetical protein BLX87_19795 [Bacillus sp. VT-16-64]